MRMTYSELDKVTLHVDDYNELCERAEDDHGAGDMRQALRDIDRLTDYDDDGCWSDMAGKLEHIRDITEALRVDGVI